MEMGNGFRLAAVWRRSFGACRCRGAFGVLLAAVLLAVPTAWPQPVTPLPDDLQLTATGTLAARTWQLAAWGVYLQLAQPSPPRGPDAGADESGRRPAGTPGLQLGGQPGAPQPFPGSLPSGVQAGPVVPPELGVTGGVPPFLAQYLAALQLQPDSKALLELALGSLVSGVRPAVLIHELRHLAEAHPAAANLQGVLALLLAMDGQGGASAGVLQRGLAASGWNDPRLARQWAETLWQLKRYPELFQALDDLFRHPVPAKDLPLRTAAAGYYRQALELPPAARGGADAARLRKLARRQLDTAFALAAAPDLEEADSGQVLALIRELQEQDLHARALELLEVLGNEDAGVRDQVDALRVESLLKLGRKAEAGQLLEALNRRIQAPPPAAAAAGLNVAPVQSRHGYQALRRAVAESMRREESANEQVGQLFLEMKRPEEAVAAFERALRVAPNDVRLRLILGHLHLGLGMPEKAVAVLGPLPDTLPHKQLLLSRISFAQNNTADAARRLALAQEAATKTGNQGFFDKQFYLYYATLCDRLGAPERCLEQGEKALALAPDDPECLNFVGYTLADLNRDLPRAEKLIRQAVAAEPDSLAILDSLAWVCYRQGRLDDAWEIICRVLDGWGDEKPDATVLEHAGDIAAAKGLVAEARGYYQKALLAEPAKPQLIKDKLQRLPPAAPPKP
ncbi:MAG: tetratricopeptide repeat protein [Lentisphaeria bacterium]